MMTRAWLWSWLCWFCLGLVACKPALVGSPAISTVATVTATKVATASLTPPEVQQLEATPLIEPTLKASTPPTSTPIPLSATAVCTSRGRVFNGRFPSQVVDPWRYYHIYLPPCYGQDGRTYPVLYYMHGSIQNDRHWLDLGLAEVMDEEISSGRFPPFIVVLPYNGRAGNNTSGGSHTIEDITVDNLVPFIDAEYCTWPEASGRAIGGISRGAYWALEIAFRHPELFGAVSGHSSQLRLDVDDATYNPLVTYAQADLSRMRIWLDWGEKDFLRNGPRVLHEQLMAAGIAHEVHVYPGRHNEAYWAANIRKYLAWHAAGWPQDRAAYPLCELRD